MNKNVEKILTQEIVKELGLDKVSVITADMLDGYTSIGDDAFLFCSSLKSIVIPDSVTSIGTYAFQGCSSLSSVTIPNNVTSIEAGAFSGCSSLTSITIPNSVTYIDYNAFRGCSSLTSVTIGNGITSIGNYAFYGCSGLTSVKIGNSVTSIGCYAFCYCTDLASVTIGDKTYENQTVTNGKCKAYKAFKSDMTCRGFQYKEGKTYEFEGEPKLCTCGFHASLCLLDVFNYYYGKLGKDIVVHEVELEGISDKKREDSKVAAKKITIGKRIL